jgi:hypothetical protein
MANQNQRLGPVSALACVRLKPVIKWLLLPQQRPNERPLQFAKPMEPSRVKSDFIEARSIHFCDILNA